MGISCANRPVTALAAATLLLAASLGGCATSTPTSSLMDARAEMPTAPKTSSYLPVEDLPPDRQTMTSDQQAKLKNDLIAARARQEAAEKASKQQ
ncbi:MAG TPA: hypothetical protein VFB02_04665 [Bradyrhizobium sp.]|nr:hypothetical protein [Bradyrhizobium sp.]